MLEKIKEEEKRDEELKQKYNKMYEDTMENMKNILLYKKNKNDTKSLEQTLTNVKNQIISNLDKLNELSKKTNFTEDEQVELNNLKLFKIEHENAKKKQLNILKTFFNKYEYEYKLKFFKEIDDAVNNAK